MLVQAKLRYQKSKVSIAVINRQRKRKLDEQRWRKFAERALDTIVPEERNATVAFVSDDAMRKLNRQFRGQNHATDVLSFPTQAEEFETAGTNDLGDVVISLQRAAVQAQENGLSFTNEVEQLILHGLLHLCGYDHETDQGEMNRLEQRLRKKLGI